VYKLAKMYVLIELVTDEVVDIEVGVEAPVHSGLQTRKLCESPLLRREAIS